VDEQLRTRVILTLSVLTAEWLAGRADDEEIYAERFIGVGYRMGINSNNILFDQAYIRMVKAICTASNWIVVETYEDPKALSFKCGCYGTGTAEKIHCSEAILDYAS